MKKHPEDSSDWSEYVNNRDEWAIPENPNPPRQSTPYDETSPWTNSTAWRYQQNPYRESPEEHRKGCGGVLFGGIALGLALVVIALILL